LLPGCPQLLDDGFQTLESSAPNGLGSGGSVGNQDPTIKDNGSIGNGGGDSAAIGGGATVSGQGGSTNSGTAQGGGTNSRSQDTGSGGSNATDGGNGAGGAVDTGGTLGEGGMTAMTDVGVPDEFDAGDMSSGVDINIRWDCGTENYDGDEYLFCNEAITYEEAVAWCQDQGMRIGRPSSDDENDFFWDTFDNMNEEEFWIDGSDAEEEGVWRWEVGTEIPTRGEGGTFYEDSVVGSILDPILGTFYADWAAGEPNGGSDQNCLTRQDDGWHDRPCDDEYVFACEPAAQ